MWPCRVSGDTWKTEGGEHPPDGAPGAKATSQGVLGPVWQMLPERQVASELREVVCAQVWGLQLGRSWKVSPAFDLEEH